MFEDGIKRHHFEPSVELDSVSIQNLITLIFNDYEKSNQVRLDENLAFQTVLIYI